MHLAISLQHIALEPVTLPMIAMSRLMRCATADALVQFRASSPFAAMRNSIRGARTLVRKRRESPSTKKFLGVALLGPPNSGKSMLLNRLAGEKIAATSRKRHTTRTDILGVLTWRNIQLGFYDTPGYVPPSQGLTRDEMALGQIARGMLDRAEVCLVVMDAAKQLSEREEATFTDLVKSALNSKCQELVLVLNKVDLVHPKTDLLDRTAELVQIINREKGRQATDDTFDTTTFMVSALQNDGVLDLKNYLLGAAKPGEWIIEDENARTDLTIEERAEELVREHLLDHVHDEIPYTTEIEVKRVTELTPGKLQFDVELDVLSVHQRKIVLGHQGHTLVAIRNAAAADLEKITGKRVILDLHIRVSKEP